MRPVDPTNSMTGTHVRLYSGDGMYEYDGRAEQVLALGGFVPPGWCRAWTCECWAELGGAEELVEVFISPKDSARILEPHRLADTPDCQAQALVQQIQLVENEVAMQTLERRVRALGDLRWASPLVAAGWLNDVPTREQWAALEKTETKEGVSVEALARAGLLKTTLYIWPPDEFIYLRVDDLMLNETPDVFENIAWAPEFERARIQAIAPYIAALQAIDAEPGFTPACGRPLQADTEPPCCP